MPGTPSDRRLLRLLLILLAYLLLTVIMTYPAIRRLSTHLVGFGDDMWVHYWNNWWVKKTLSEGGDVYTTSLLFYPEGASLLYHNFGWLNVGAWLAVEPVVGGIAAYNLVHLLNITLCAYGMFLLARYVLRSDGPAFVAGLVHGFWPYRLSDYGHPNMVSTQWLPLLMLCIILLIHSERRLVYALLAGLFTALTALSRWQMLVPTGVGVGLYLLMSFVRERERWSWSLVNMLSLASLVALLLIAVPVYPIARDMLMDTSGAAPNVSQSVGTQADVLNYVVPPVNHPLVHLFEGTDFVQWRTARTQSTPRRIPTSYFLGYSVLLLVLAAVAWRGSEVQPWVILALTTFFLALGPLLRVDRHPYPHIPMPYRLVGWLPPIRVLGKPHRFNTFLALPVALLAAYGAEALRERVAQRRSWLLWGILGLLILFDYAALPFATVSAHVPSFYDTLADEAGDFALAELPGDRQAAEYHMFYQTIHGRPLLTGHISRLPPGALDFTSSVPLTSGIYESGSFDTTLPDVSRQLSLLADVGFRYVILHKNPNLTSSEQLTEWRRYLVVSPRYEDEDVIVYSTRPEVGKDCLLEHQLGEDIGLIESSLSPEHIRPDGVIHLDAVWGTTAAPTDDVQLEVRLIDESGNLRQTDRFDISPDWPPGEWPADTILREEYAVHVDPRLPGGGYDVTVALVDVQTDEPLGQSAVVGRVTMDAPERVFTVPTMSGKAEADFGDALRLLGYDLHVHDVSASLTLHWKARRRMETSYKFFVHIMDAENEQLAAQVDAVPRNWTYPTTWWNAGEVVSDKMDLPLDQLKPGAYHLRVGVYVPDTGERLPVKDAPPRLASGEGWLKLAETIRR